MELAYAGTWRCIRWSARPPRRRWRAGGGHSAGSGSARRTSSISRPFELTPRPSALVWAAG
eukprot:1767875-Pyramimonas_sp.AAC.1